MAWLTRCSQFEFDDRQMYFLSLQLSSVNCLETTLLVKLAIDSLVFVQQLLDLVGLHKIDGEEYDDSILKYMDKGLDFKWDKLPKVSLKILRSSKFFPMF